MKNMRLLLLITIVAAAHTWSRADSWYPRECCPLTCAPVDEAGISVAGPGQSPRAVLMIGHGRVSIPDGLSPRASQDNRMHACIGYDAFGDREVKCLFAPLIM